MAIVLRPKGNLDLVGSATLQQKLERVANLASANQKLWVIDLGEVSSINHFGLTALVNARRTASEKSCRLFLRNIQPSIQLMLEIAHLKDYFDILPNNANFTPDANSEATPGEKKQTHLTETSLEQNNASREVKKTQSHAIDNNLQKILTNFKSKMNG